MTFSDAFTKDFSLIKAFEANKDAAKFLVVVKQKVRQKIADWEGPSVLHYRINARGRLENRLNAVTVNGKVVSRSRGMDCDCASWDRATLINRPCLFAEQRSIESAYEWAEGPLSLWYERPTDDFENFSESRDLALEAYEEGHPHVVYY